MDPSQEIEENINKTFNIIKKIISGLFPGVIFEDITWNYDSEIDGLTDLEFYLELSFVTDSDMIDFTNTMKKNLEQYEMVMKKLAIDYRGKLTTNTEEFTYTYFGTEIGSIDIDYPEVDVSLRTIFL